ncbi:MAG: 50S ribosomal protein L25, partial [Desulfovibrionaceae bacterium]|nr:50S ribosomal protein L25 [Desulfovibrionaceae bacterium]
SVQYHPYKKTFTHIDFYGVDLDKTVKVNVPVEFTGVSRGVKLGGRLETYREQVQLVSKPLDMPKKVTVDITNLDINKTIYVADLQLPEGVQAAYANNFAIVSVISKSADETGEEAAAE